MSSIEDVINHYQTSINKSLNDTARIVHCIGKLYKLPISVRHLQETGIGRTVNSLRKYDGEVGVAAKALVTKWKAMVASEESDDGATGSGQQQGSGDPGHRHNGDRSNRSDMSDEEEDGGGGDGGDDGDDDHDGAMVDDDDEHDDDVSNGSNGAEEEETYAESQLRDGGTQSDSESEDESDDQTNRHHQNNEHHHNNHHQLYHHHHSKSPEDKPSASHWNEHHSSSSSGKERQQPSGSSNHHNHHTQSSSTSGGGGAHKHSTGGSSSKSESDHRRHASSAGGSGESKSHKSSSSRGEGSSSKSSSHGDGDRHRERSSSKHHTSSTNGVSASASGHSSSSRSSSARKDSSHKESRHHRSKEEEEEVEKGGGSSKRHAQDATVESASKRSRKEHSSATAVEPAPSSSHSNQSSKPSSTATPSSSSSSKHRDRHERSGGERRSEKGSDSSRSKSKRKEKVQAPSSSQEEGNGEGSEVEDVADGLDGSGGASFADALAMIGMPGTGSKKRSSGGSSGKEKERVTVTKRSPSSSSSTSGGHSSRAKQGGGSSSSFASPAGGSSSSRTIPTASELLSQKVKLEPLPEASEIVEALPMISPHYRPMPLNLTVMDCVWGGGQGGRGGGGKGRPLTEEEALGQSMQSKNLRTKVYSGMKTNAKGVIPTLYELCIRLLQDHLDEIGATGGIPFYILRPVLERANPNQLLHLEHFNPHFVEDSDVLWEQHCKRTFRAKQRNEEDLETWREMFLRCSEERDAKLKSLTQNIKLAQEQAAAPVRKTQLAYVDSAVKPPRSVINKQARYGTARAPVVSPAARVAALKAGNVAQVGDARLRVAAGARDNAQAQVFQPTKPRKAPMMAKVLSSMKGFKGTFRR
uniref:Uncharacterized protein n=1 Tax=Anopheles atroparvus TaxID=41427 RepID=A0A182J8L5_ANOAO